MTATTTKQIRDEELKGSVCVYGNNRIGTGYFSDTAAGMVGGDGCPHEGRNFTSSLRLAVMDLEDAGLKGSDAIAVHMDRADGLPMVAKVRIQDVRYFGDLSWEVAPPAVVISAEQVEAMAAGAEV